MICNTCGAENTSGSTCCTSCGAALQPAPESTYGSGDFFPDFRTEEEKAQPSAYYDNPAFFQQGDPVPVQVPKQAKASKNRRQGPSLLVRIPLQLLSLIMCLVLVVCLLATALLLDCNRMLSAGGIKQLVSAVLSVSQSGSSSPNPSLGAVGAGVRLDTTTLPEDALENIEIPSEVLTGGSTDALVDWLCEVVSEAAGQEVVIDRDQVQTFVSESTVTDYVAEKAAGYAEDFIQGTRNTQITTEELKALFDENEDLLEQTFQIEVTPELRESIDKTIEYTVEENNLNETIHEQVFTAMEEALDESVPGMDADTLRSYLQLLTSGGVVWGSIGLCIVLVLLLCALNFYNLPGGVTWSAVSCILAGIILSLPVALLQGSPALLTDYLGVPQIVTHLVTSFLSVFAVVHYGMLAVGAVLLLLSIVWRVIRATARPIAEV